MNNVETVLAAAQRLHRHGAPYALVSVIKAVAPASARPGDKAVVTADGQLQGWVGGGCAQPAVIRTVRQALRDGQARVIRIAPAEQGHERDLGDVLEFGMACHSGGTLELFVDPVMPRPRLVVIGASPVAHSLCGLAPQVGFDVTLVAAEADRADFPAVAEFVDDDALESVAPRFPAGAWVVVATQGRRDLQGLRLALGIAAREVSFVASARKAQVLKASLLAGGADAAAVADIVAPAGYPMAAATPEEIALSVLAAVVSKRRGQAQAAMVGLPCSDPPADPPADPRAADAMREAVATPIAPLMTAASIRQDAGPTSSKTPTAASACCGGGGAAVTAPAADHRPSRGFVAVRRGSD